jgi:hypothetical protein
VAPCHARSTRARLTVAGESKLARTAGRGKRRQFGTDGLEMSKLSLEVPPGVTIDAPESLTDDHARVRVSLKTAVKLPPCLGSIVNVPSSCLITKQRCFGASPTMHTS